jgi:MFS family permease
VRSTDQSLMRSLLLLNSSTRDAGLVLFCRGLRAFSDGALAILLPLHLFALGYNAVAVGTIATGAMLGSALLILLGGLWAYRLSRRVLLLFAAATMCLTGIGFALFENFWLLLTIAFLGTLNPSSGDVSLFVPLEHTVLAQSIDAQERTALFARYSFIGGIAGAFGSLSAGLVDGLKELIDRETAIAGMFLMYALSGAITFTVYRWLSPAIETLDSPSSAPLGPSRGRVYRLAALFSLDAFAGGFVLNTLLAVWLFQRFGLSVSTTGSIFFIMSLCSAFSYLVAARIASRFGSIPTMVFTHLPANLFLVAAALAPELWMTLGLLVLRSLLSQMDVPVRSSYVMAVVRSAERPAASSFTAVPRSLTASMSPAIAGWLLTLSPFGWPLVIAGALKIVYDLTLLRLFAQIKPPEEL